MDTPSAQEKASFYYIVTKTKAVTLLKNWSWAMAIIHGISSVVLFILILAYPSTQTNSQTTVVTDFTKYDSTTSTFGVVTEVLPSYSLVWVLITFSPITAIFHLLTATVFFKDYLYRALIKGTQPYRWIEYAITANIMQWIILTLSGATNLFLLVSATFSGIGMILLGLIHEQLNKSHQTMKRKTFYNLLRPEMTQSNLYTVANNGNWNLVYAKLKKKTQWSAHVTGFILFVGLWLIILTYFFAALASNAEEVPWFVWTIDIGLFFQFAFFGFVQTIHYMARDYVVRKKKLAEYIKFLTDNESGKNCSRFFTFDYWLFMASSRVNYELTYLTLSLTSKLFLNWFLFAGIVQTR